MISRRHRSLTVIGHRETKLQDRRVDYILKRSERIRGIRLEIHPESGLTVVVPRRFNDRQVNDILTEKAGWILKHLPASGPHQMPLFKKQIDHGEHIQYMGKTLALAISKGRRASATLTENTLSLSVPPGACDTAKLVEDWYRRQAHQVFCEKADHFQALMGVRYSSVIIRGQRKRWASASPRGTLSINWKLLLAPERIIDYVIMHELAHFKHMDHSKRFWDFLAKFCPRWREYRRWLTLHEEELKEAAAFIK